MSRKRKRERRVAETAPAAPPAIARDWPLAVVAGLGMVLTAVLLWNAGSALPYCGEGSSCDVVQSSAWSRFLGLPLALLGFGAYALLGLVALGVRAPGTRARWTAFLATAGFGISLYLTAVSVVLIEATCGYCLVSLALMAVAFALSFRRSEGARAHRAQLGGVFAAVLVAVLMHADASGVFGGPGRANDPYLRELAAHLEARGIKFYGASWCPHCQEQKELFGGAARLLPYVECAPNGPRAPRATVCEVAEIHKYPTWEIDGRRLERMLTPRALARLSGFRPPDADLP